MRPRRSWCIDLRHNVAGRSIKIWQALETNSIAPSNYPPLSSTPNRYFAFLRWPFTHVWACPRLMHRAQGRPRIKTSVFVHPVGITPAHHHHKLHVPEWGKRSVRSPKAPNGINPLYLLTVKTSSRSFLLFRCFSMFDEMRSLLDIEKHRISLKGHHRFWFW